MITRRAVLTAAGGVAVVGAAAVGALALRGGGAKAGTPMGAPQALPLVLPAGLRAAAIDPEHGQLWIATRCDAANAAGPLVVTLHCVDGATGTLVGDPIELSREGSFWRSGAVQVIRDQIWMGFGDRLFTVARTDRAVKQIPVPWRPAGDGEGGLLGDMAWDGADTLHCVVGSEGAVRQMRLSTGTRSATSLQGAMAGTTSTLGAWEGGFAFTAGNTTATRRDLPAASGGVGRDGPERRVGCGAGTSSGDGGHGHPEQCDPAPTWCGARILCGNGNQRPSRRARGHRWRRPAGVLQPESPDHEP